MWRKILKEDFDKTSQLQRESGPVNCWGVCAAYELKTSRKDGIGRGSQLERHTHEYYISAKYPHPLTDTNKWTTYKPLEVPDLFLKFARLATRSSFAERALEWSRQYGVLGLAGDYHWGWTGENKARKTVETLEAFEAEVTRAAGVLALYEAALNKNYADAKSLVLEEYPAISEELWSLGGLRTGQWDTSLISESVEMHSNSDYLAYALEAASWIVESTIRGSCYPILRPEGTRDPAKVASGWGFKNLRGAMYLQMYWLMAAGSNVTRCGYCGRIISLASPLPGARKTRQDKKFCDNACRQRHHYHTKTKLKRQGGKAR